MTIELLIIFTVAAVYGMVLGTAAAGERVPFVSAAWDMVRRPVDWLVSAATRR